MLLNYSAGIADEMVEHRVEIVFDVWLAPQPSRYTINMRFA